MTFVLNVSGSVDQVVKDLGRVGKALAPKAASRALNRAVSKVRTEAIREIAGAKNIPQKALRGGVGVTPGGGRRRAARFRIQGKANPHKLSVRILALVLPVLSSAIGKPTQKAGGAAARGHSFPGSFVQTMRSGHTAIFKRTGGTRRVGRRARQRPKARGALPIKEQTVSLEPEATRIVGRHVNTTGMKAFRAEFNRLMAMELRRR